MSTSDPGPKMETKTVDELQEAQSAAALLPKTEQSKLLEEVMELDSEIELTMNQLDTLMQSMEFVATRVNVLTMFERFELRAEIIGLRIAKAFTGYQPDEDRMPMSSEQRKLIGVFQNCIHLQEQIERLRAERDQKVRKLEQPYHPLREEKSKVINLAEYLDTRRRRTLKLMEKRDPLSVKRVREKILTQKERVMLDTFIEGYLRSTPGTHSAFYWPNIKESLNAAEKSDIYDLYKALKNGDDLNIEEASTGDVRYYKFVTYAKGNTENQTCRVMVSKVE